MVYLLDASGEYGEEHEAERAFHLPNRVKTHILSYSYSFSQ